MNMTNPHKDIVPQVFMKFKRRMDPINLLLILKIVFIVKPVI